MSKPSPTLARTRVVISYTGSDGYMATMNCKGGKGSAMVGGGECRPEAALLAGLRELARLTALFGFEAEALTAFAEAQSAVAEWKAKRAAA